MSNPGSYEHMHGDEHSNSNNPWAEEVRPGAPPSYGSGPPQQQQQQQQQGGYGAAPQQSGGYSAPPGPPPRQAPAPAGTFEETDFIPDAERGEQREAMQQFEMNKSGNESEQDRHVAQLSSEFPGVDGSLIAALYGDSHDLGATREMLQELASQTEGAQ